MKKTYYWNAETQRLEEYRPAPAFEGHYVIDDTMRDTFHPAAGKVYDGRAAYRRATKERGLTEVGNEYRKPWKKPETRIGDSVRVLRELIDHSGWGLKHG